MLEDIDRVLISQDQIARRVAEMAAQITDDHLREGQRGEIMLVPILTGALVFCSDLMRQMAIQMKIGLVTVSSYPGTSVQSQGSQIISRQLGDIRGRHVLLLDDILDSGGTIRLVKPALRDAGAADVRVAVLLRKDRPSARDVHADYVGFDIPDEFVVGYGLDYDDYYRNLPDIVVLKPSVFGGKR
jgi:hypoxanthine phosphoribosyltransferase